MKLRVIATPKLDFLLLDFAGHYEGSDLTRQQFEIAVKKWILRFSLPGELTSPDFLNKLPSLALTMMQELKATGLVMQLDENKYRVLYPDPALEA